MTGYEERLTPSTAAWLLVLPAAAFATALVAPFSPVLAPAGGVVAAAAAALLLARSAARIQVDAGELRVGQAHVPLHLLGRVDLLESEPDVRHALGPGLDARAHVCTRPWVRTAVRVELRDPADPTPYWVVATRSPRALAAALQAGRPGDGQAAHSEHTS